MDVKANSAARIVTTDSGVTPVQNHGDSTQQASKTDEKKELVTVTVTPYEQRLLEALRSEPNRLHMWLSYHNKLSTTHKPLIAMYNRFYQICNKHNVEYWLEYGSLLGYVRHRCITPWEWDMDVGCTPENFKKLSEVGKWYEENDPEWGFKFYHDPDYATPGFSFYWKPNPEVLCDICEYVEEGDQLVCKVKEWNYPNYNRADIFPLRRVMMLGEIALVPNKAERVLGDVQDILGQCTGDPNKPTIRNKVPFMQYDPVPFLLCHLLNPKYNETLVSRPTKDVPEAKSIVEGFREFASKGLPFIVRKATEIRCDRKAVMAKVAAKDIVTFAFEPKTLAMVKNVSVHKSIQDWEQGQLSVSFLDSPVPTVLDAKDVDPALAAHSISADKMMLILNKNHNYTPFHIDAATTGGGWMLLAEGKKVWQMIDYLDGQFLLQDKKFRDPGIADLLYEQNHALWGKIYHASIDSGDFLYFPPGTIHRVWTYQASFGVGGYATCDLDATRVPPLNAWMKNNYINPLYGVWNGIED